MIATKKPSQMLLFVAYACMLATFVTGLLWIVSAIIAWQLKSNTDDIAEKLHCRWILKSNIVFVVGLALSLLLLFGSMPVLSSNSIAALIALLMGVAIVIGGSGWYAYRSIRGLIALHAASLLPNA
jgi:uncharacterized membrane protein